MVPVLTGFDPTQVRLLVEELTVDNHKDQINTRFVIMLVRGKAVRDPGKIVNMRLMRVAIDTMP